MALHHNHANGGCGLPGAKGFIGKECEKFAERIVENHYLSEGAEKGQGHYGHFQNFNTW